MTDDEFNRYVKVAALHAIGALIPDEGPSVKLSDGCVTIRTGDATVRLRVPRHAESLAFQLQEAGAELKRRALLTKAASCAEVGEERV